MNTQDQDCGQDNSADYTLGLAERWIISQLQQAETQVLEHMGQLRLDLASQALYDFVWKDYCDWYIELSKPVLWDEHAAHAIKKVHGAHSFGCLKQFYAWPIHLCRLSPKNSGKSKHTGR